MIITSEEFTDIHSSQFQQESRRTCPVGHKEDTQQVDTVDSIARLAFILSENWLLKVSECTLLFNLVCRIFN